MIFNPIRSSRNEQVSRLPDCTSNEPISIEKERKRKRLSGNGTSNMKQKRKNQKLPANDVPNLEERKTKKKKEEKQNPSVGMKKNMQTVYFCGRPNQTTPDWFW